MERNNLAAEILRWANSGVLPGQLERVEQLSHQDAINLADWLQGESPLNAWRTIYLTAASPEVEPKASDRRGS
jgi:hypothetical protein